MIPTVPGSLEQLQEKLEAMVDKINQLPIERIAGNLDSNLVELRKGLVQFNAKTLPGVHTTLDGRQQDPAIGQLDPAIGQLHPGRRLAATGKTRADPGRTRTHVAFLA